MRVLRDFFDAGGRIIATGTLPTRAFEYDPADPDKYDKEMVAITEHIFGKDALDSSIMREYCTNSSPAGGVSYFLYFSKTGIDGVSMVNSSDLRRALSSFKLGFDVFAPKMPTMAKKEHRKSGIVITGNLRNLIQLIKEFEK
jgi:hypothetical protein